MLESIQQITRRTGSTCAGECGQEWARLDKDGLCPTCAHKRRQERHRQEQERIEQEAAAERQRAIDDVMAKLDAFALEQLRASGLEPRELRATTDRIAPRVKAAMDRFPVRAMIAGEKPGQGWGLIGTTGNGKTMALAAVVKAHAIAALRERVPKEGAIPTDWIRWESWPILADWLRDHARSDARLVGERLEAACTAPILVLDDLGAERRIADYGSDYAVGKLDIIIDRRYRACLPTWYTANVLDEAGLVSSYGARMVSRLCSENPSILVEGRDQRFA